MLLFPQNKIFLFISNQQLLNFQSCFSSWDPCWDFSNLFFPLFWGEDIWLNYDRELVAVLAPLREAFLMEISARWFPLAARVKLGCPRVLKKKKQKKKQQIKAFYPIFLNLGDIFNLISAGNKEDALLPQHSKVMSYFKIYQYTYWQFYPWLKWNPCKSIYSACWVGVAMGKDAASITSKVAVANPAGCLSLSFLNINHQRTMRSQCYAKVFFCEFLSNSADYQ